MAISAVQPAASTAVATVQTGSQVKSWFVAVAGERRVALDPGGVDLEGEGGALVEVAVDVDRDVVAVDLVAARHAAVDARPPWRRGSGPGRRGSCRRT